MKNDLKCGILSGNMLKIIALVSMTVDHVGYQIFPDVELLRIIGRIAYPIFAFMIAEGCKYTKSKSKYFLKLLGVAAVCQVVYFVAMSSLSQCIMVTFSLSVLMIFSVEKLKKAPGVLNAVTVILCLGGIVFLTDYLPAILKNTDYSVDYGLCGVMLPVFVYMANTKIGKLTATAAVLVLMCIPDGGIQWYSLLSVLLLALYNGERGKLKLKNLFYIYYPAHLAGIYLISLMLRK